MTRKLPALPDAGRSDEPYLFFTPLLLLTAALSFGAIVLLASEGPAASLEAQQQKCPQHESPCPTS